MKEAEGYMPDELEPLNPEPEPFNPEPHEEYEAKPFVTNVEIGKNLSRADYILADYLDAKLHRDRGSEVEIGARFAGHMVRSFATLRFSEQQQDQIKHFYADWSARLPRGDFEILKSGFLAELATAHALNELSLNLRFASEESDKKEATDLIVELENLPSPFERDREALLPGAEFLRIQVKALPLAPNHTLKTFYPIYREWLGDMVDNQFYDRRRQPHLAKIPKKVQELATEIFSIDQWDKNIEDQSQVDQVIARKADFANRMTVLVQTLNNEANSQAGVVILPSYTKLDPKKPLYDKITGLPRREAGTDNSKLSMDLYRELRKAFVFKEKPAVKEA